jgi:hypothetical protein
LKDIARRMAAAPGERTMVLISSGFYLTDFERREEEEVIDRAIRSNVTVNAVDARGLYVIVPGGDASTPGSNRSFSPQASTQHALLQHQEAIAMGDAMAEVTDGTGGRVFRNNNDLKAGLREVTAPPEFIYLLGFSPQNLKLDGGYHNLKVSLNLKNGSSLTARRGYYAPKHEESDAEIAHEEIGEALFSRDEVEDIPVRVQTQFFKTDDEKAKLAVVARIDLKALHFRKDEGRNKDTLIVVAGVFDHNGNLMTTLEKTIEMKFFDRTFDTYMKQGLTVKSTLDVGLGSYVVRVVLRDQEGKMMSARNRVVEIPY